MQKDIKRLQRLIRILQSIDGSNPGRLDLANRFDVSERQIYRDTNALIETGFPITYSKKKGTYSYENGFTLKKIALSQGEMQAVVLSREIMNAVGGAPSREMDSFFSRLVDSTKDHNLCRPVSVRIEPGVDFQKIEAQYNALLKAAGDKERVKIEHLGQDGKYSARELDPYRLFYSDGFWYVIGYCRLREDIRTFALDRIRYVEPLDKYFGIRRNFDFEAYMAGCWKKYSLGEPEEVAIRFSAEAAKDIKRKTWHPKQRIKENSDGSIDLAAEVAGYQEILRWVLSWGRHAKILSPENLRKQYREELKQMSKAEKKSAVTWRSHPK